jgi:hypothetical protein
MEDYAHGVFPPTGPLTVSGPMVELPTGQKIHCDFLRIWAKPIVAHGPCAVPALVKWVQHENRAVRYIAIHSLQEITRVHPEISTAAQRDQAIKRWEDGGDSALLPTHARVMIS